MDTATPCCRIALLGGLRLEQPARTTTRFQTEKTALLLAYLAHHRNQTHPREALAGQLWPDADEGAARVRLRQALASLRRQLEPPGIPRGGVLLADRRNVGLNPGAVALDVAEFEAALKAAAKAADPARRAQHLERAIALYGGRLLPGYDADWILLERERLAEAHLLALQELAALLAASGDVTRGVDCAHRAVAADPLREESRVCLMRLLLAAGQPAQALRQFRDLERLLAEAFGEAPAPELRALAERAAGQAGSVPADPPLPPPPLAAPASPPPPLAGSPAAAPAAPPFDPPRLPLYLSPFFGRTEEAGWLVELLTAGAARLVTLTGPGGEGKTRLAVEVARRLEPAFPGAVWFVPLADLTDARFLADAVADALRLERSARRCPWDQVAERLGQAPALLVLDNLEQLIPSGGAAAVRDLLARAPGLRCLVTSRQRLLLEGERVFRLPPLPTPPGSGAPLLVTPAGLLGFPSVQLFVDRAQAVRPDFQITEGNAAAIAQLCDRLEGIPLALELAAARSQALTPSQMLAQLGRRFDLLVSRNRDADPRHRTLRAALDWSFGLLSPELRRFLTRLCVFRGGFTPEAARAICQADASPADDLTGDRGAGGERGERGERAGAAAHPASPADAAGAPASGPAPDCLGQLLGQLEQLQECSLVLSRDAGGEMRFYLPDTLREYAREQLSPQEEARLRQRHARFYLALAERAQPFLAAGREMARWLPRLEGEHDNLRVALGWCTGDTGDTGDATDCLRLVNALGRFWEVRGHHHEGRQWYAAALSRAAAAAQDPARDPAAADPAHPTARDGADDGGADGGADTAAVTAPRAEALYRAGILARGQGDCPAARALYEASLGLRRAQGDRPGIAACLNSLGLVARDQGDFAAARALLRESLALSRELNDRQAAAHALGNLGNVARDEGDCAAARELYGQGLALCRETGNKHATAVALVNLGAVLLTQGDPAGSRTHFSECLRLCRELGDRRLGAFALEGAARIARSAGRADQAAWLSGAAAALRERLGVPPPPGERREIETCVAAARGALGADAFRGAWERGGGAGWEQAVAFALEVTGEPGEPEAPRERRTPQDPEGRQVGPEGRSP